MATVLMSNPGLHLAVLGNPRPKGYSMAKHRRRRSTTRRNPGIAALGREALSPFTGLPKDVPALFKGQDMIKKVGITAAGLVGTYMLGGIATKAADSIVAKLPGAGTSHMKGIYGGVITYLSGFGASMLLKGEMRSNVRTGAALAAVIELLAPGRIGGLVDKIPGMKKAEAGASGPVVAAAAQAAAEGATNGIGRAVLAGYVTAASYQGSAGIRGYVEAPAYQGTNGYVEAPAYQGTNGYVEAPAYSGTGEDLLAGNFMEDSSMFVPAF
jgi:hypothetical protein